MIENTDIKGFKLVDFPEETDSQNGIKVYGETSLENQMAVLSLYLHDKKSHLDNGKKREIVNAIRDFLIRKKDIAPADITDDFIDRLAEAPAKYDLFSDFFNIPFRLCLFYFHPHYKKACRAHITLQAFLLLSPSYDILVIVIDILALVFQHPKLPEDQAPGICIPCYIQRLEVSGKL